MSSIEIFLVAFGAACLVACLAVFGTVAIIAIRAFVVAAAQPAPREPYIQIDRSTGACAECDLQVDTVEMSDEAEVFKLTCRQCGRHHTFKNERTTSN